MTKPADRMTFPKGSEHKPARPPKKNLEIPLKLMMRCAM